MTSAEEFAQYIQLTKPYLVELEAMVQQCKFPNGEPFGELDVRLSIRNGIVEKMTVITSKTWLKKGNEKNVGL
jgi:hypothetical protein